MTKAALLLLLAAPLHAGPRTHVPEPGGLILGALTGPATGWTAVERVQVFLPGKKPKSMKVEVSGAPGKTRRAYFAPRGKTAAFVEVRLPGEPAEAGLARLRSLYEITASTGGAVAKRRTWKVELRLKSSGVLRRALWIDRDSGLLMKRETYRDDGTLARRERLTSLVLPAATEPALFAGAAAPKPWSPDGFVPSGPGAWSNGLETYTVKDRRVEGLLAEDDAARAAGR